MKLKFWTNTGVMAVIIINYFIVYRLVVNNFMNFDGTRAIMLLVLSFVALTLTAFFHLWVTNGEYLFLRVITINLILFFGDTFGEPHILMLVIDFILTILLVEFVKPESMEIRREM